MRIVSIIVLVLVCFAPIAHAQESGVVGRESAINYRPQSFPQEVEIVEGDTKEIWLEAFDANIETLSFEIEEGPALGNLAGFDPATGTVTYVTFPGASGDDSFRFCSYDKLLTSRPARVVVKITAFEDVLFRNGFESGGTMEWSTAIP